MINYKDSYKCRISNLVSILASKGHGKSLPHVLSTAHALEEIQLNKGFSVFGGLYKSSGLLHILEKYSVLFQA